MSVELWDIYSSDGAKIGKTAVRGRGALKQGEYHLVVHIWIVSSSGELLIQRRSDKKKLMPGEWAATGGAAVAGEDSFKAAKRELFEELGIMSDEETLKKLFRIKRRNSLLDVYAINSDIAADDLHLQETEVAEAKWVSREVLTSMIKNGKYHDYGREYFAKLFEDLDKFRFAVCKNC